MVSVQNNFGYVIGDGGQPSAKVSYASPNAAGNGLIVVAEYWRPATDIYAFEISDSQGNNYVLLGACATGAVTGVYLAAWYVRSCAAGSNAVTIAKTASAAGKYILSVSIFEYATAFGPLDAATWSAVVACPSMSMSLSASAAEELIFSYAANCGTTTTVSLDPSSVGYTAEQAEAWNSETPLGYMSPAVLAVDKIVYSAGVQSIKFDFGPLASGLQTGFIAAIPLVSPPPAPPTPPASPVSTPLPGTPGGWPTIF